MTNTNPKTGIRYGVISGNKLDDYILNELMYTTGTNVTQNEHYEEKRAEFNEEVRDCIQDGTVPEADFEDEVERRLERYFEHWECDEPKYEGIKDGVNYQITWLGGAILVWALDGLKGWAERLCSPCVPGAADLDGGYTVDESPTSEGGGYKCHVVPKSWLREES